MSTARQLRRLCAAACGCLAVLSVGTAVASMVARRDVLSSLRINDDWEIPKAVGRDMSMAVLWAAVATKVGRLAKVEA